MGRPAFPFALGTFAQERGAPFPAITLGTSVHRIDRPVAGMPGWPTMLAVFADWEMAFPVLQAFAGACLARPDASSMPQDGLRTLVPVEPRQIVCAGANYRKHVIDLLCEHAGTGGGASPPAERRRNAERIMDHRAAAGQPFAFIKPFSTLLEPFGAMPIPVDSDELDWELELAVVIGRPARRVPRERALDHVAGYTVANDISAHDHLARPDFPTIGFDWVAGKGGPGFLPLGPVIVPAAFVPDPQQLQITLRLNGEVMQDESTADMIFHIPRLIEFVSTHMQLLPGDVICTGSPSGNGTHHKRFLRPGDVMEGTIVGIGVQMTTCVAEQLGDDAVRHRPFAPLS